ncbi:MAG: hypothetical protein M3174_07670 [Actinomycetota bacterium]|nr:hypothetical protein [Actinomycetota bacterium]
MRFLAQRSRIVVLVLALTLGAVGLACDEGGGDVPTEEQTDPEGAGNQAPGGDAEIPEGDGDGE